MWPDTPLHPRTEANLAAAPRLTPDALARIRALLRPPGGHRTAPPTAPPAEPNGGEDAA